MRLRWLGIAALCPSFFAASTAQGATTTVGQLFAPTGSCSVSTFTDLQTGVSSGTSYTVPFNGFIVSWSFQDGAAPVNDLKLKVARAAGGGSFTIVGDAVAGPQVPNSVNTYPTQIPVGAGDVIGIHEGGGNCLAPTGNSADTDAFLKADPSPGTTATFGSDSGARFPVAAQVAPPCVVPKLKGKSLKAATRKLRKAGCALGRVRGHGGTVRRQRPKPGAVLPPLSQVALRLT